MLSRLLSSAVLAAAIGAMHPLLAQTRSTVATVSGMPAVVDPTNLYSETAAGKFDDRTRDVPHRVYVPNVTDGSVTVIDPLTMKIIDRFDAGRSPHHVVPSYDLKTLWVAALDEYGGKGGALTPIDARTGKPGKSVPVPDAYNLYFTPDGSAAVVVAEGLNRLEYRDPQTMELRATLPIEGCAGINHADFSIDGSFALFTCEFGGTVIKVDLIARKVLGLLKLSRGGMPQDIRIAPDGSVFFVADMMADGVFVISAETFTEIGFVPTGLGSHGLYPSRDGKKLYVANRGTHRITGAGLYVGMALLTLFLLGAAIGGGAFAAVSWIASGFVGNLIILMIVWAIFHHLLGGVRHALWDRGLYMDPRGREWLAQGTLVGGILLTLLVYILKTLAS